MFLPELKSKVGEDICLLIKLDNYSFNFICECGDASELTVKECQNTEAIFISHTHIDHFINFDFILRHQLGIGKRIIICGPEGITNHVQSKIKAYQWNLIEENSISYEIREIKSDERIIRSVISPPNWEIVELENNEPGVLFKNDRFTVEFVILDHKTDSIAYLFRENDTVKIDMASCPFKGGPWIAKLKSAFENKEESAIVNIEEKEYQAKELFHLLEVKVGNTLGVIMDHAAHDLNHEKIKKLFAHCDQVFIESFYKVEDQEFAKANYHSYSSASAKIMKASNVKSAIPVHFSRKYKAADIDILLTEFEAGLK